MVGCIGCSMPIGALNAGSAHLLPDEEIVEAGCGGACISSNEALDRYGVVLEI